MQRKKFHCTAAQLGRSRWCESRNSKRDERDHRGTNCTTLHDSSPHPTCASLKPQPCPPCRTLRSTSLSLSHSCFRSFYHEQLGSFHFRDPFGSSSPHRDRASYWPVPVACTPRQQSPSLQSLACCSRTRSLAHSQASEPTMQLYTSPSNPNVASP